MLKDKKVLSIGEIQKVSLITNVADLPVHHGSLDLSGVKSKFKISGFAEEYLEVFSILFLLRTSEGLPLSLSRQEAELMMGTGSWVKQGHKVELFIVSTILFKSQHRNWYIEVRREITNILGAGHIIATHHLTAEQSVTLSLHEFKSRQVDLVSKDDISSAVRLFDEIGSWSLDHGVSDIHYEIYPEYARVLVRRDGILSRLRDLSPREGMSLVTAAFNTLTEEGSTKENFNPRVAQNAVIDKEYAEGRVRFRFGSVPVSPDGVNVVLRLLLIGVKEKRKSYAELGYSNDQTMSIRRAFGRSSGVTIIAGTTGSGKSTTLKNAIEGLISERPHWKFRTIEDPVEYRIDGASQTSVVRKEGDSDGVEAQSKPFIDTLKACLRTDPDFIMVGEVRDRVTAELTLQAAQTGHQVATTVHADSWIGIIQRMALMGVDPGTMAQPGLLSALIYQTLMPVLCSSCKVPVLDLLSNLVDEQIIKEGDRLGTIERLKLIVSKDELKNIYLHNSKGCEHCDHKGTMGRTICAEVALIDEQILECIMAGDSFGALKAWRGKRVDIPGDMTGRTAGEHALYKMKQGIVSPFHIEEKFKFLDEIGH